MNIFGVGIDVVEIGRIASSRAEFGEKFTRKIFTENEIAYCERKSNPEPHYAARFAAKEAVAKALGTGIGKHISWHDMEIRNAESGEPLLTITGNGKKFCEQMHVTEIKISLSHAREFACANAVVMCE